MFDPVSAPSSSPLHALLKTLKRDMESRIQELNGHAEVHRKLREWGHEESSLARANEVWKWLTRLEATLTAAPQTPEKEPACIECGFAERLHTPYWRRQRWETMPADPKQICLKFVREAQAGPSERPDPYVGIGSAFTGDMPDDVIVPLSEESIRETGEMLKAHVRGSVPPSAPPPPRDWQPIESCALNTVGIFMGRIWRHPFVGIRNGSDGGTVYLYNPHGGLGWQTHDAVWWMPLPSAPDPPSPA